MVKLAVNLNWAVHLHRFMGSRAPSLGEVAQWAARGGAKAFTIRLSKSDDPLLLKDVTQAKKTVKALWLVEATADPKLVQAAARLSPSLVCLASENGDALVLDGVKVRSVAQAVSFLKKKSVKVVLVLGPHADTIRKAKRMGVRAVRLSTGPLSRNTSGSRRRQILEDLSVAGLLVQELGMELHVGGGLSYGNVKEVAKMSGLEMVVVDEAVASRSVEVGLANAVEELNGIIEEACAVSLAT